ncbi:MAG: M48 family metallopeptidase [Verrucomicrobia subdivision 3 bacterium]|nr:M48 family metallopeptidase [Limisphaerales bacterium]
MDFFARQDQARRNTKLLVVYFVLAVGLIIASVYFASLLIFQRATTSRYRGESPAFALWNPKLFLIAAGGTLAVITCGSLFKTAQLSSGGSAVAESLRGRLVDSNTNDRDERKLLNVVEEMAIASGVPTPQVYVLDHEQGINAFAAGHTPNDAAIGVTRGCIATLKRDELQGVIGHEFSHILNGDMRLNLRLMGIIFGIVCLAVLGRVLLHTRSGNSKERNPLPLLGLVLLILGWVGVFFAQLIQAAVSRQREFLADASAVQFTRNPAGLSGALQKIGAVHEGSRLETEHAQEASHMFFGNALKSSVFSAFATHPPLEERIRAIDPGWDGTFPNPTIDDAEGLETILGKQAKPHPAFLPIIPGLPVGASGLATAATAIQVGSVLPQLGQPTSLHLRYAVELRESLPESVRAAARDPQRATALLYALLLSEDAATRATQLAELAPRTTPAIHDQTVALWPEVLPLAQRARLPVVNLALPALRQMRADEFQKFSATLAWLIESDEQIVLFEYVLQKIIQRQIVPHFTRARPAATQFYTLKPLAPDCAVLLSALAHTGQTEPAEIFKAFQNGVPYVRATGMTLTLLSRDACGLAEIGSALDRLAQAVPQIKKNLLEACARVVGADGVIQESEAELLRGIAETLDCPIPPFLTPT